MIIAMMKVVSEDSFYDAKFKDYNPKYININSNSGPIGNLSIILRDNQTSSGRAVTWI
jgi:hypothetical protein